MLFVAIICISYSQALPLDSLNLQIENQIADSFKKMNRINGIDTEFRSINGSNNNLLNPLWGTSLAECVRFLSAAYNEGNSRMNPREISNLIGKQDPSNDIKQVNDRFLTQFTWQWAQFIDRDIALISQATRDPRKVFNKITSFLDASNVYGAANDRAQALRSENGMMREDYLAFFPKDNINASLVGGDIGLLTMHIIFVRLHNIIAQRVKDLLKRPTDENIYQYSKLIVTAIIQKITYYDFLPDLFGIDKYLGKYQGYDASINPGIFMIFASAANRYRHSQIPEVLPLRTDDCSKWRGAGFGEAGYVALTKSFFAAEIMENIQNNEGLIEAVLNGFVCTLSNKIDTAIIENLLEMDVYRGREHGVPNYNSVRKQLGLTVLRNFSQLSSDTRLNSNFKIMYGEHIDDIDLFLGGLAEDHLSDSSFGETFSNIILTQFARIRDGDRFWYENYIKPGQLLDFINFMSLKHVIELTTDIVHVNNTKDNVFKNSRAVSLSDVVGAKLSRRRMGAIPSIEPQKGNIYDVIDVHDLMYVVINLYIERYPTNSYASILHVGNTDIERYPAVFLHKTGYLHVAFSSKSNLNQWWNSKVLPTKTFLRVVIKRTQTNFYLKVSDQIVANYITVSEHHKPTGRKVYFSDPWHERALVRVNLLSVTSPSCKRESVDCDRGLNECCNGYYCDWAIITDTCEDCLKEGELCDDGGSEIECCSGLECSFKSALLYSHYVCAASNGGIQEPLGKSLDFYEMIMTNVRIFAVLILLILITVCLCCYNCKKYKYNTSNIF